jgi:thioredoxin 1
MTAKELNDSNFDAIIAAADKPVLVDFHAEWCGPCKMLSPLIDEIAEEQSDDTIVAKVNIEDAPQTASRYGITSIPALLVFKDGQPVSSSRGVQSKDAILKLIKGAA